MTQFLSQSVNFIDYVVKGIESIELNFIGEIIRWLIEGIGIVGVGIIVFTLILKTIVLPLDIYSRVKTKKMSLIMKSMRPDMEKLQKQYADDKNMYQQKVMELQRKNGYSPLGACLPTLVSLIIFIVVFNAFSSYSQFANLESYNGMVKVYNESVSEYVYDENENTDGFLIEAQDSDGELAYRVDFDNFVLEYQKTPENATKNPFEGIESDENAKLNVVKEFMVTGARAAVSAYYEKNNYGFLWVKNIWYPDSALSKAVPDFNTFKNSVNKANIGDYEDSYNEVTYSLSKQKDEVNGYFILILLAIGGMLLQQFITMRAQKDANELSTVDGQAAQTNKMMMIMMPVIYGIFSFFYSASFSIYMITNTCYSLITTLIINKAVDISFEKKSHEEEIKRLSRR